MSSMDVAIVGVGLHPFGRFGETTGIEMGAVAIRNALADAGVQWDDIQFAFDTAPPGDRFTTGETVVVTISGVGITAEDFDVLSAPAGGHGPYPTAAHVQGIGASASGSGWVTVPEPSGAILFGVGTLLAGAAIRRRS